MKAMKAMKAAKKRANKKTAGYKILEVINFHHNLNPKVVLSQIMISYKAAKITTITSS